MNIFIILKYILKMGIYFLHICFKLASLKKYLITQFDAFDDLFLGECC